jgi:hypothetical protein
MAIYGIYGITRLAWAAGIAAIVTRTQDFSFAPKLLSPHMKQKAQRTATVTLLLLTSISALLIGL